MQSILIPAYDFDGNILAPDTRHYFFDTESRDTIAVAAHEVDSNPYVYANRDKFQFVHQSPEQTYQNFFDFFPSEEHPGPDGFLQDIVTAMEHGHYSPSFENFKQLALIEAHPFAIITARGHSPDNLQRVIENISYQILTDQEKQQQQIAIHEKYGHMRNNYCPYDVVRRFFAHIPSYIGVSNTHTCHFLEIPYELSSQTKKPLAYEKHYQRIRNIYSDGVVLMRGFSDDSIPNIIAMATYFLQEKSHYPDDKYRLYFTGKRDMRDDVRTQMTQLPGGEGVEFVDEGDILKIRVHN